jgi:hypothetical protein
MFLAGTYASRGIMTVQNTPLRIGWEEVAESQNDKQQYCHEVGQQSLENSHNLQVLFSF